MIDSLAQMDRPAPAGTFARHLTETAALAAPIGLSLLAEMAMGLISTIMLGGLGEKALAAGGLGTSLFFTTLIILQGVLSGVGVLAAGAIGGGRSRDVSAVYWSGIALAAGLSLPLFALLSAPGPLLHALGEPDALTADISLYVRVLRWGVPPGMVGIGVMRQFLPAVGLQRVLVWIMPGGVLLHAGLNHFLIHGGFGMAGFGFAGSASATVGTLWALSTGLLLLLHGPRRFRALVAFAWPKMALFRPLLAIGLPVGATVAVEATLFLATGVMAGAFGPMVLAAHTIALSVCSVIFMVPLSISQAGNVRVASAIGGHNRAAARRAGFSAIGLCIIVMGLSAAVLNLAPGVIVGVYLGPTTAANVATAALAARLLRVASVFQLADGTQVAASGALRGLQDTRVPMFLAVFGYWGIGFWAGRYLAFNQGLGAVGLWWGLCAGLATVAVCVMARFAARS